MWIYVWKRKAPATRWECFYIINIATYILFIFFLSILLNVPLLIVFCLQKRGGWVIWIPELLLVCTAVGYTALYRLYRNETLTQRAVNYYYPVLWLNGGRGKYRITHIMRDTERPYNGNSGSGNKIMLSKRGLACACFCNI